MLVYTLGARMDDTLKRVLTLIEPWSMSTLLMYNQRFDPRLNFIVGLVNRLISIRSLL